MKKAVSFLLALLYLSACGLSPQIVTIDPELNSAKDVSTGSNFTFNLVVLDSRESDTLGSRGGVYQDTSVISTKGDITLRIHQNLADAFNNAGYKVNQSASNQLNVSIVNLKYKGYGQNRISEIEVNAEILATVTNSKTEFTKSYKANHKKEVLKAPDEKKNSELINDILATVIQRVLDDDELLSYLKK